MKSIRIAQTGGPEVMRLAEIDVPRPAAGEALVRHEAIGVNFIDVYYRTGIYPAPQLPFTPGMEAAGVVEAVGNDVSGLRAGDRVAYAQHLGSYAEYAAVPAAKLVRVPEGVSSRDAAALMLQGMTAHYLAEATFPLGPQHTALVHAGAGGVGLLLIQIAKSLGARVTTTVSSAEKAALARAAGADLTIDYTAEDFAQRVRDLTAGAGADVVYDSVGKTTFEKSLASLRPRGMLVLFGASSGPVPPFDIQLLNHNGSLFLTRPSLAHYTATPQELNERATDIFERVAAGTLRLRIAHEYSLADAATAHRDLERRATTGKVVLYP